jgi:hypothetical protein
MANSAQHRHFQIKIGAGSSRICRVDLEELKLPPKAVTRPVGQGREFHDPGATVSK